MVRKWLFDKKDSFFFRLTSNILEASYDHEKIMLVRQPILDIYSTIKSIYNCNRSEKQIAYIVKRLNKR